MNRAHSVSTPQPAAPALDPAEAERAARMLDRLAEMAMERAEAMHVASLAAIKAGDTAAAKDLELSLDRVGRCVRRALALKLRLARDRQEMADKAAVQARDRAAEKAERRRQVARAVSHSIAADRGVDEPGAERLSAGMWERLIEDEEIDAALAGQPIEEIVICLCRDIGIDPKLVLEDEPGRGRPRKVQDAPPAWVRPFVHPEESRYCILYDVKDGEQDGEAYWWDLEKDERCERPSWATDD
ncbi:hypothetical protein [Inquilinus sp.]|jgi:hypothetical protein|uniref:hypothetical protein n=1 Tax=Inquilinus sp. TaxID=1932117 RepID=UPI00378531B2